MGLLTTSLLRAAPPSLPADSVGVEKRDGKRFVIHHVDQGQTLFAIARRYHTSVSALRAANPDIKDAVKYDQVVRVPLSDLSRKERKAIDKVIRQSEEEKKGTADAGKETKATDAKTAAVAKPDAATGTAAKKPVKKAEPVVSGNSGIHVVETGQTLYSLAVRYGVPQASLRKWNNLSSDNVLIGQALIVSERAYTARQPAKALKAEPAKPASKSATTKPAPVKTEKTTATTPPPATPPTDREHTGPPNTTASTVDEPAVVVEPKIIRAGDTAPLPTTGRRISDIGLAEVIEGNDDSGKYLALHRSAPIGTLVQVRNDVNNQSIWVKVVGRLPNTGVNDRILVKLTGRAFAKLSPSDRRFRAEVSYIVP